MHIRLFMRRLTNVAPAVVLVICVTAMVLWVWSQWTFARITCSYAKDSSDPLQRRQLVFLMWRDAAEVIVRTNVYHPDDAAARARLRLDLPRERHVEIYHQSGISTAEDGDEDAAEHWGFWYRSPEATRRKFSAASKMKPVGDGVYEFTEEAERAFFLPWWFLVVLFGALPAIMVSKLVLRSLRMWGGRCVQCGYDIRFASDRCPECGTPVTNQPDSHSITP